MKKKANETKLILSRETLRQLTEEQAKKAEGGQEGTRRTSDSVRICCA